MSKPLGKNCGHSIKAIIPGFQPEDMGSIPIARSRTKDGAAITFEYFNDIEGDNNRGWQVDQIKAFVDGQEVGYLKLSYIPRERFNRYYPSIFNWLSQMEGKHILPFNKQHLDPFKHLDAGEIKRALHNALYYYVKLEGLRYNEVESLPDSELLLWLRKAEGAAHTQSGDKFEDFYAYYVNRPLVDYIHVNKDFRQRGIGTALYIAGAKWMAQKGMQMYASTLQQPEAAAAWKKMQERGWVKIARMADKDRRYLEPTLIGA
jgi:GNAT superfamily N-acetyltransferase